MTGIVEEALVYAGWTELRRVRVRMANGLTEERHIEDHGLAIGLLPYDPDRGVILFVSMPRAPVLEAGEPDLLEAIGGLVEGESPELCARRETLEEAGLLLGEVTPVGRAWTMPSLSTERVWLFLARYSLADRVAAGGGACDENEQITVHEIPAAEAWRRYRAGGVSDMKTVILLHELRLREPAMFPDEVLSGV